MQPGTNPEDIHTILSRFNHWAGTETANGNGHAKLPKGLGLASPNASPNADSDAGVREIPYDEAMRRLRNRKPGAPARVAAQPAVAAAQPVTAKETAPAAETKEPAARETALEIKARSAEKSMRRASGRAPSAKKTPEAKIAKAVTSKPKPTKQTREPERKTQAAPAQEFRQVLAKTVRRAKPAVKKETGRDQRVSVRLSRAEEHCLQTCAAKAGVTVSEYLRMRALESAVPPARSTHRAAAGTISAEEAASAAPAPARPAKSSLGDWLALLRNRFLASPGRFAERA